MWSASFHFMLMIAALEFPDRRISQDRSTRSLNSSHSKALFGPTALTRLANTASYSLGFSLIKTGGFLKKTAISDGTVNSWLVVFIWHLAIVIGLRRLRAVQPDYKGLGYSSLGFLILSPPCSTPRQSEPKSLFLLLSLDHHQAAPDTAL